MPLPDSWPKRTVRGTLVPLDESIGVTGVVSFMPIGAPWFTANQVVVPPSTLMASIVDGSFSMTLPVTNAPGVQPAGWVYQVTVKLADGRTWSFPMDVPNGLDDLDLAAHAPVAPSGGWSRYVRTVNGILPDATGNVHVVGGDDGSGFGVLSVDGRTGDVTLDDVYASLGALSSGLATKANTSSLAPVATAGTYASLTGKPTIPTSYSDLAGTVPQSAIPAVALVDWLGEASSQAAMLALTGQRGDWCTRTDRGTDWQLIAEPSTSLASWRERVSPASPVSSVNGRTGAVVVDKTDVGLGAVNNTPDSAKPISAATQTALDGKESAGTAAAAVAAHTVAADPHPQYLTQSEGDGRYDGLGAAAAAVADAPRFLRYSAGWPARGSSSRVTIYIGGSAASNAPVDAVLGDVWIPASS
ncbi:hypothetical protein [Amycolatopsis sp. BJA-103]|uniref:hypothetical protein n=1 Tax=Amycolatopsis sp. BJA-103 TaxID=1911175 RepID=UPI000C775A9C|nr:hypothetical protein [Amycolatopsis sp. BJA-103]AUI56782.1 hypothetical protein BKN51_00185 [Amycolatopsis sp. BJA-103]PNE13103.1 hypothetical protein B1H26_42325 [Amycolatopsis sp. BJA-103]